MIATQILDVEIERRGILFLAFGALPIVIGAWVGYKLGGYDVDR